MADNANKTRPTGDDVEAFVGSIADEQRRRDAQALLALMAEVTGEPAVLWGSSIVGFGSVHYRYATGREGDVPAVSFAPRKAQTTLYLTGMLDDYAAELAAIGPHTTGKGCLYLKRVDAADPAALRAIVERSWRAAAIA
jgi:Domain of unknown function (DU1801)